MSEFLDLLRDGTLLKNTLPVMLVSAIIVFAVKHYPAEPYADAVKMGFGIVLGYFFGNQQSVATVRRVVADALKEALAGTQK